MTLSRLVRGFLIAARLRPQGNCEAASKTSDMIDAPQFVHLSEGGFVSIQQLVLELFEDLQPSR
jgi:hypothetical protein